MLAGGVAEDDGVGFDLRGGARVAHGVGTGLQIERHSVADDGEVLIIDGERGLGDDRERRGGGEQEEGDGFHRRGMEHLL